jgi:hypothetical protein
MRTKAEFRALLGCALALLLTASIGVAQQPVEPKLPDGLRHVPPDAMGFVYIRAGEFLKGPIGSTLLAEVRKDREASKGLKKLEQMLGIEAADLDSVTILMLPPAKGQMNQRPRIIYDKLAPRDWDMKKPDMPRPPIFEKKVEEKKEEKFKDDEKKIDKEEKKGDKDSPVLLQEAPRVIPQPIERLDRFDDLILQDMDLYDHGPDFAGPLAIVTSAKPLDRKKILRAQLFGSGNRDIYGPAYGPSVLFLSDRTVMVGTPWDVSRYSELMARKPAPKNQPMKSALALGADPHLVVAGGYLSPEVRQLIFSPFGHPDMQILAMVAPLLQTEAGLAIDMDKNVEMTLHLNAPTEASAANALQAAKTLRVLGELALEKSREAGEFGGWKLLLEKSLTKALADVRIEQKGLTVQAHFKMDVNPAVAKHFTKEIVAQLRHSGDRAQTSNNLKQIALAMHSYHDAYKHLPGAGIPAMNNPNGKPLLSWRVAILPFIEQQGLYQQFDLNQPWDHPTNKKLIAKMPAIYMVPGADAKEGETNLRVLVGPGTIFEQRQGQGGLRLFQIPDGTSNTIMVVEAHEPIIWTRPDDLPYDPKGALPKFGISKDGFHVAFADGSVRFIRSSVPEDVLRIYLTGNNGIPRPPLDDK